MSHYSVLVEGVDLLKVMAPFGERDVAPYLRECVWCRRHMTPEGEFQRHRFVSIVEARPGCPHCQSSGAIEETTNPIEKWDSFTVTHGELSLKPGRKSMRNRSDYRDLCWPDAWIGSEPGHYPLRLATFDTDWDQARRGDIDFEASGLLHTELLVGGVWYEPNYRFGSWFPSRASRFPSLVEVEHGDWENHWKRLVLALPDETILSFVDCHT